MQSTQTIYIHIEWWTDLTGREILINAVKGCSPYIMPEAVHVYNPNALNERGADWGECDLWFSCITKAPYELYDVVDAIRNAGIRVKEAGIVGNEFARASMDDLYAEMDRLFREAYPEYAN
jgi:hypothetical protein